MTSFVSAPRGSHSTDAASGGELRPSGPSNQEVTPTPHPAPPLGRSTSGRAIADVIPRTSAPRAPRPPDLSGPVRIVTKELPPPPPLGASPLDLTPLATSPATRHLGQALQRKNLEVRHLFAAQNLRFTQAPDPTVHLQETQRANADRRVNEGAELRVMTYNVALLDLVVDMEDLCMGTTGLNVLYVLLFPIFFWFKFIHVRIQAPLLEERRKRLPQEIFTKGDDVVMLQEVWLQKDVDMLAKAAKAHGYVPIETPRDSSTDGLITFVRRAVIDANDPVEAGTRIYEAQQWREGLGDVRRTYQKVRFTHPTLGPVTIFNTHMQPHPNAWMHRTRQSRELGLAAREAQLSDPTGVVILGGDLNSGPFYAGDVWLEGDEKVPDFYANGIAYGVLEHYSGLSDLMVAGRNAAEADDDVELGRNLPPPSSSPIYPFTASSLSNSLYAEQYSMDEPPARLDHLRANTATGRIKVMYSEMAFTEDLHYGTGRGELSDHYAVRSVLRVAPPAKAVRRPVHQSPQNPFLQLRPARSTGALGTDI